MLYIMLSKSKKGDFVLSHVCSYSKAAFYLDFYLRKNMFDGWGQEQLPK